MTTSCSGEDVRAGHSQEGRFRWCRKGVSGVEVDPGECFLVKLVVLGPRNAGLANSTKHKPRAMAEGQVTAERVSAEVEAEAEAAEQSGNRMLGRGGEVSGRSEVQLRQRCSPGARRLAVRMREL